VSVFNFPATHRSTVLFALNRKRENITAGQCKDLSSVLAVFNLPFLGRAFAWRIGSIRCRFLLQHFSAHSISLLLSTRPVISL
jgi:hypothetical protein